MTNDLIPDLMARLEPPPCPRTAGPRLYVLALRPGTTLPGIRPAAGGLLYIGISEDSGARDHFTLSSSGSSPRRSLGALLRQELGLAPLPRGMGGKSPKASHYHFGDGEARLSAWMAANLFYACTPMPGFDRDALEQLEGELVRHYRPPMNVEYLDGDCPNLAATKAARLACRQMAARLLA